MPSRYVFCLTGYDASGGKAVNYSTDSSGISFDVTNIVTSPPSPNTKNFDDIRYNLTISQWIATGTVGGDNTSRLFYSNDAYNWSQSVYTNGGAYSVGGQLLTGEYGLINNSSPTFGWLCYGLNGSIPGVPIGVTTSDVTSSSAFTEYNNTFTNIDLSGSLQMKLRGDNNTNWILVFNKSLPPFTPDSYIYHINTSTSTSADPNTYTYTDISANINPPTTYGPLSTYAQGIYSSASSGNKWAVCGAQYSMMSGLYSGGFVCMTSSTTPTSSWNTVLDTSDIAISAIATDNNGTWVAVGTSLSVNQYNMFYSTNDGSTWISIIIGTGIGLNSVATNGVGDWVAIGSDTLNNPVAFYSNTSNLNTWTASSLGSNTLLNFTAIDAGLDEVPCFLKGTLIRTPTGEVPIETLKEGDEVVTTTGEIKAITNIQRATVPPTESTNPYKIPEGDLGATQDLYLSPTHGVRTAGGETVEAQFLGYPQEKMDTPVEYYNISIGRLRSELIYANGVAVESMGADGKNTVADVSTFSQERIFTEEVRSDLIDKLNKKMKISYDKLVSYPDSYLQELLSR